MSRLHILVEGQTEEVLCRNLFEPHLGSHGWIVNSSKLTTKRLSSGRKYSGGVASWSKIERDIRNILASKFDIVTTVIDYYAFPKDAPGMGDRPEGTAFERVNHVEHALAEAIGDRRFVPHLTLHEAETWVFAAAEPLAELMEDRSIASDLLEIAKRAGGPELINDDPVTAPSKRLLSRLPAYQKTLHGPLCIEDLGLTRLREQCPHLDDWLARLEGAIED